MVIRIGPGYFLKAHEEFFGYLVAGTNAGDGAADLDLYLALIAFSSEGSFTCYS
jgi:hypothetical protein